MKLWGIGVILAALAAGGPASAADGGGLGTVLKDAAADAAGQAARDAVDKAAPRRDSDRDVRDRDRREDRDRRDRDRRDERGGWDRGDAPGKSYDHRRDGRGAYQRDDKERGPDKRRRKDD